MTRRLVARRPEPADLPHYAKLLGAPEVGAWLRPPPLAPFGAADPRALLDADVEHWSTRGFGPWVLLDRVDGAFVGRAGLAVTEVGGRGSVELASALVPERFGQGLATEAARAAVAVARGHGLPEVVAFTLPTNAASLRVMERAGLTPAGEVIHAGLPHALFRLRLS